MRPYVDSHDDCKMVKTQNAVVFFLPQLLWTGGTSLSLLQRMAGEFLKDAPEDGRSFLPSCPR
jgi:hypothetical protein